MKIGYSQALRDADVALTNAITAFVYRQSDASLGVVHERMAEYRDAALSSEFQHAPITPLIELAFARKSWDATIPQARC
jgi:hypothetical protein